MGLYKGLGPVVATITPKIAIRFTSFHQLSALLSGGGGKERGVFSNLIAGLGAGAIEAVMVVCPSEVVKIRQQDPRSPTLSQIETLRACLREGGVATLYRGVFATTLRQAGQQGLKFASFYQIKTALFSPQHSSRWYADVVAGALANSIGAVINSPLDVVKSRIQRQVGAERVYKGILQSAALIVRQEGPLALSKGCLARVLRIAPAGAVQFWVFESVAGMLR